VSSEDHPWIDRLTVIDEPWMTAAGLTIFTALGDGSGNNPETPEQVTQNFKVTQQGTGAVQRSVHRRLLRSL
jgi:hypothetical protein